MSETIRTFIRCFSRDISAGHTTPEQQQAWRALQELARAEHADPPNPSNFGGGVVQDVENTAGGRLDSRTPNSDSPAVQFARLELNELRLTYDQMRELIRKGVESDEPAGCSCGHSLHGPHGCYTMGCGCGRDDHDGGDE